MKQMMSPLLEQCFRNTSMDVDVYSLIDNTFVREGTFLPLVLLPMNTKKKDIRALINASLHESGEKEINISAFHAMWWKYFSHVQIPKTSRFSKCSVCWEFTSTLEKIVNNTMKDRLKKIYQRHHELQRQEWDAYEDVKLDARNRPNKFLSIVVDGMDQNTTMVPKMRQTVKNIEGQYVKTHLCGVLVHGWGLYCDVWIDAHHRHDSNQVVTSIMGVLNAVHSARGSLPPICVYKQIIVHGRIRTSFCLGSMQLWWAWSTLRKSGWVSF
jgi:hypothetical protein